jgi:HEAT repeat protein
MRYAGRAVPRLLPLANHSDPRVRFRVVWLLGKSQSSAAYPAIVERIEDSDARVAYDAIMALGEFGDPRSIPLLQELASRLVGRSDELLGAALMALAKLGVEVDVDEFNLR